MSKATIVVPVYNEEGCLPQVLDGLGKIPRDFEIIFIDDGSTDDSLKILKAKGMNVIQHPFRRGNGAAVKTGIRNASADIIIVFDSDGQYFAGDIPSILNAMSGADLVIGNRVVNRLENITRRMGNIILSQFASFLIDKKIPDLTCGFRAFRKESILKIISLLPEGFSLPSTSTMLFMKMGLKVKFIPVISAKRKYGSRSKLSPFKSGIKILITIIKVAFFLNPEKVQAGDYK